ncbi:glycosyltransferase family 2 protein [Thiosulfatimonas sediminis]|uniref:glycosyltransferase family 2 protein n=1 Tax=Thiosulfatimonas sediminis TaxID=2675054 RepID=UPI0015668695|nr:glycosyltransferase family 2 protein [Thiosulfatimonas sediminis]
MKIAIGAIVKNEADYLLEWIAYHWVVGVRHFLIASNDSTDETSEILQKLVKLGLVTFVDFPTVGDVKPQLPAYKKLVSLCPNDIDLIAFIDADEYLTPLDGELTITPFIDRIFADQNISALAMQWACFGSAGQLFKEDGMVIERFTRQSAMKFTANKNYKTMVRPNTIKAFRNPHYVSLKSGRYVNTLGEDVAMVAEKLGVAVTPIWENLRVNHYVVKSLEEFVLGKSRKGSAASKGRVKHKDYFKSHDRNEEVWSYPDELIKQVHETLNTLTTVLPKIESAEVTKPWFKKSKLNKLQKRDKQIIEASGTFDKTWYLLRYPDVANAGIDPIEHFLRFGVIEKRDPTEFFDLKFYINRYQDVSKSSMNPFVHYLKFGLEEGRVANAQQLT